MMSIRVTLLTSPPIEPGKPDDLIDVIRQEDALEYNVRQVVDQAVNVYNENTKSPGRTQMLLETFPVSTRQLGKLHLVVLISITTRQGGLTEEGRHEAETAVNEALRRLYPGLLVETRLKINVPGVTFHDPHPCGPQGYRDEHSMFVEMERLVDTLKRRMERQGIPTDAFLTERLVASSS